MEEEVPLRVAVDQAWTVYLSAHKDVNAADSRRCSLQRYLLKGTYAENGKLVRAIQTS